MLLSRKKTRSLKRFLIRPRRGLRYKEIVAKSSSPFIGESKIKSNSTIHGEPAHYSGVTVCWSVPTDGDPPI